MAGRYPGGGDYILRDIPSLKVEALIVRGKDGVIRAFYNSCCSHRGVALVNDQRGRAVTFRCPYHSWLDGADGTLRAIPHEEQFPGFDKAANGLTPIALDCWNGFIFINLDREPRQSLREFPGGLGKLHETPPFGRYPVHTVSTPQFAANWKAGMHSFSEGYHITIAHSRTLTPQIVTAANPGFRFFDIRLFGPHSTLISERNFDWRQSTPAVSRAVTQMPSVVLPRAGENAGSDFARHPSINRIGIPNFGVEIITIFPDICLQPLGAAIFG